MAQITKDDVKKLARLSAISMTDDEVESYKKQIEGILQYVEQLQNIDTTDVAPTTQVTGLKNVMRKDAIDDSQVSQAMLLRNLPEMQDNQIKVPRVL